MNMTRFSLIALVSIAAIGSAQAQRGERQDDILLRQPNGSYQRANPGGAGGTYTTRPEGDTYTGVYDRRGDRVGTIRNDAAGARLYNNRGDRR